MTKRRATWERDLEAVIRDAETRRFVWGQFDCALFTTECIAAMTGVDLAEAFRGKYSTRRLAKAVIRSFAGTLEGLADKIAAEHGIPEIPPAYASRGDVVLIHEPDNPEQGTGALACSLGIVGLDNRYALCPGMNGTGLRMAPMQTWVRAWRI